MKAFAIGLALTVGCAQTAYCAEASGRYDDVIAKHAQANGVPETLVRRIIQRESRYNPAARNGPYLGMMQISAATARSMGYRGAPSGLLDADTNLTYAVRYLSGAYRTAGGDHDRATRFYSRGYYYDAKRKGLLAAIGLGRDGKLSAPTLAAAPAPAVQASAAPQTAAQPAVQMTIASTAAIPMPPVRGPILAAVSVPSVPAQALALAAPTVPLPQPRDAGQPQVSGAVQASEPKAVAAGPLAAPTVTGSIVARAAPVPPVRPTPPVQQAAAAAPSPSAPKTPASPRVLTAVPAPAFASAGPVARTGAQPETPLAYAGADNRGSGEAPVMLRGASAPLPPRR